MSCRTFFKQKIFPGLLVLALFCGCQNNRKDSLIKILILSGKNNHEWQKTTPLLVKIYKESQLFSVSVTEMPDTLSYKDLIKFDAVVSNWNTWPDNDLRLSKEWENDFFKYVNEGGGVVSIHAGASSFYKWNEYHQIGIGRWGKDTKHGKQQPGLVGGFDQSHPITKGFRSFYLTDEMWELTDIYPGSTAIASVSATDLNDGHSINGSSMFVNQTGKGRSFFTIFGHNERALLNKGLQSALLRATQWVSQRDVTYGLPAEFNENKATDNKLTWEQSDTTLSLMNYEDIVWKFNFNNRFGKPYFHPLTALNSTLTCLSPTDHPWHLGLWFSWKFINGVNYWEYLNDFNSEATGYKSAGITKIQKIILLKNPDFSSNIQMELQYHPADGNAVMNEKRNIHTSRPFADGSYFIDFDFIFQPLINEIILDRTPVSGEPDGQSWGGYSGLSVRFNQDYSSPEVITHSDSIKDNSNNWLYMGFRTLTGESAGMCIMKDNAFSTSSTIWYLINDPEVPFYYFSPAVLFGNKIVLKKGEALHLKYRTWIIPGKTGKDELQAKYNDYMLN